MDRSRVDDTATLVRELVALLRGGDVTFLAAAIAYYAFVSLLPSLTLLFSVATLVGGEEMATEVLSVTRGLLSPVGEETVVDALERPTGRATVTVVSLGLLAWSTLKVFRGLDIAFSEVYNTEADKSFVGRVRDASVALGAVGAGLAALVAINAVLGVTGVVLAGVLGSVALVVVLTVVFFPLFYLFPDSAEPPRLVLPGTVVAAGGWTLLGTGFRVYAGVASQFSVYGVLGGALLLVTWYYVGSMALLLGAGVNAVLAGRADDTGTNKSPPPDSQPNDSV